MVSSSGHGYPVVVGSFVLFIFIALLLSMALRLFTRIKISKQTDWEDWTIYGASILYIGTLAMTPKTFSLGYFKPIDQITLDDWITLGKISLSGGVLYALTMGLIKISILLQMIRIFIPLRQTKSFYWIVSFAVFNTLWFTGSLFITVFQCKPVSKMWDPRIAGSCLDYSLFVVVAGAVNTVSDLILLTLPMFWILRLRMDIKRKLTAGAVFVVGLLACVASIVRLVFSIKYLRNANDWSDSTMVLVGTCMSAEMGAGIICANLPNLPAFIKHFKGNSRPSTSANSKMRSSSWSKLRICSIRSEPAGIFLSRRESSQKEKDSEY